MATGDKIYIADKETLDSVHETVDKINTDVESVNSTVNDIKNTVESNPKEYLLPTEIEKLRYTGANIHVLDSYANTVNLSNSSGILYFTVAVCKGATTSGNINTTFLQIIVDGVNLYQAGVTLGSGADNVTIGYVSAPSVIGASNDNSLQLINGLTVDPGTTLTMSPLYNNNVGRVNLFSIKPIKFNTSLVIKTYATSISGNVYCYYKLD